MIQARKIDWSTMTILTGGNGTVTLPAGHWIVFGVANILTRGDGSFATTVKWMNIDKNFQGYRVSGQNRNQSEFTFVKEITVQSQTTYTCSTTGDGADVYQCWWLAIKLG